MRPCTFGIPSGGKSSNNSISDLFLALFEYIRTREKVGLAFECQECALQVCSQDPRGNTTAPGFQVAGRSTGYCVERKDI
jgi:hypothetical protein